VGKRGRDFSSSEAAGGEFCGAFSPERELAGPGFSVNWELEGDDGLLEAHAAGPAMGSIGAAEIARDRSMRAEAIPSAWKLGKNRGCSGGL